MTSNIDSIMNQSVKLNDNFMAHSSNVNCLSLGNISCRILATGGEDKLVNLWTAGSSTCIKSLRGHTSAISCVKFNKSDVAVGAGTVNGGLKVWDLNKTTRPYTMRGHQAAVRTLDFCPSGDRAVSGSDDGAVILWDSRASKPCLASFRGHTDAVTSAKISPDGNWIVSGGKDGSVKLWDWRKGELFKELDDKYGAISDVQINPEEYLVAFATADSVVMWDVEKFEIISTTRQRSLIKCIRFSADGKCLYSGTSDDLKVLGWEPKRVLGSEQAQWGEVHDMLPRYDNQALFAASIRAHMVFWYEVDVQKLLSAPANIAHSVTSNVPTLTTGRFSHGQSVRKSFTKHKQSVEKSKPKVEVKRIDESMEMEADEEIVPNSILTNIPVANNYEAVFKPNRMLNRSPPPATSSVASSDDDVNAEAPSIESGYLSSPITVVTNRRSPLPAVESPTPAASHPPHLVNTAEVLRSRITMRSSSVNVDHHVGSDDLSETRRMQPEGQSWEANHNHDRTIPVTAPSNLATRTQPVWFSTASRTDLKSDPSWDPPHVSKPPQPQQKPPAVWERSERSDRVAVSSNRPSIPQSGLPSHSRNKFSGAQVAPENTAVELTAPTYQFTESTVISLNGDGPVGLDANEFLPKRNTLAGSGGDGRGGGYDGRSRHGGAVVTEAEALAAIALKHQSMMVVLQSRQRTLQLAYSIWRNKDFKSAMESIIATNDQAALVDILNAINYKTSIWNLDACVVLLPAMNELLQSKYENYATTASESLSLILRNFGSVIKSNASENAPHSYIGVDITKEERQQKCSACYKELLAIRSTLTRKQTMRGKLGNSLRQLLETLQKQVLS